MEGYSIKGLIISLLTFVNLTISYAFHVHVTKNTPLGSIIFDSSLEGTDHWMYTLNPVLSSDYGLEVVALPSHGRQGTVMLQSHVKCSRLLHNPFTVYIDARTSGKQRHADYTRLPLHVHVESCHRLNSKTNQHRQQGIERTRGAHDGYGHGTKETPTVISVHTKSHIGTCLQSSSEILSLSSFLPSTIQENPNCECTYKSRHAKQFRVNSNSGILTTTSILCLYEPYVLVKAHVKCTCASSPNAHMSMPVKIKLHGRERPFDFLDVIESKGNNENTLLRKKRQSNKPPSFQNTNYIRSVLEEQNPGVVVDSFVITEFETRGVTYSLLATRDGRSQDMFAIDPNTGQVTTSERLDRESIPAHYFMVYATDKDNPRSVGQTQLRITVEDVNDHPPVFERVFYQTSVSESLSVGATVVTVRASDGDAGLNAEIEYSILNPSGPNEVFRIDPMTGSIITRAKLDREKETSYTLQILASDKGPVPDRQTASAIVEITVLDENDNKPQFSRSSYTVDVSEDIDPSGNPVIAEIIATDGDEGANSQIRYSITGGNTNDAFSIDASSGQLSLSMPLDYERTESYRLTVRAQDGGSPPKSNSTTVLIRIIDVNDNYPRFLTSVFQEAVLEDEDVGYVVMRVQAFDADEGSNSALLYSIKDAPRNLPFSIDRHSGILSTSRRLDREEQHRFNFKVEAKDQGEPPRSASATIEVKIRDVNDNSPIFEPKVYNEVVSEEDPLGTPVVTVTAKDRDENENARVTYAISSGNSDGAFSIISQMGQGHITVAKPLNYKQQSRYILTVTATDPGNRMDTATVFINVTDANNFRPEFQGTPYQIKVPEDTAVDASVFKVQATDKDVGENARITYSMDENEAFYINPATGDIIVKDALDRESTGGYALSVTATDHGRPPMSDTADIELTIEDVNDNDPVFEQEVYNARVPEDALVGTSIITISATDKDIGLNGRLRYTFEGGNSGGGDFIIDPTVGVIRTDRPLDREKIAHYRLVAYAVDRGTPERSTSVVINLELEDVNDNRPQFESQDIDLNIFENSPIGSTVDTIIAVDPDEGVNAEVEYSIVGGADGDLFALETGSDKHATITTLTELDYESGKTLYEIIVRAGSKFLFFDATVYIHVVDVNDNIPELEDFTIIFNNFKNHFPTLPIGKVPAHDPDVNDQLTYKFISGNQAQILHLEENTGLIRLDSRLNSDVPTNATLQASVSDGINEVRAVAQLFVRLVTDSMLNHSITIRLNDTSPAAFLSPLYQRFVSALATIIPTTEDNIFIINVQKDTDVSERILNVSFSVREMLEHNVDVFYSPQFLREKVYLQRTRLTMLSTLEVLPFDDNLCVIEPCLNFEECVSILKFGNASSFISSDSMLFRPIHPVNAFDCICPIGFTGMTKDYLCDTEVNLCYSSPCGMNGTCVSHETGYSCHCIDGITGDNCEIDMRHEKYQSCPVDVCKSGSHCSPLIRGGFRCEQCPANTAGVSGERYCVDCKEMDYHTEFCELTTRSFPKGSFLMFPSLKRRHRFDIRLEFTTQEKDGLLLYNGRYNEMHDFIALEIVDRQVQFSFSLGGAEITTVSSHVIGGVTDGSFHEVFISYVNRSVTLTVGQWCDAELAVKFGERIGNYTCAKKVTQVLEDKCNSMTEPCHRLLDLTGPLQIGGLPYLATKFKVQNKDFVGCMRNVYIDQQFLDLNDNVWNNGTSEGCPQKKQFCSSSPCKNGGMCLEAWGSYLCNCPSSFGGKDCSQNIELPRRLKGSSYLHYDMYSATPWTVQLPWYNGISFRTRQSNGPLMSIEFSNNNNKVEVEIKDGYVNYIYPQNTITLDQRQVNDGKWHYLETRWLQGKVIVTLDYGQLSKELDGDNWAVGNVVRRIYVGGEPRSVGSTSLVLNGLKGCVENIRVGSNPNALLEDPQEHNVEPGCDVADPCDSFPCPDNSYCNNEWEKHSCTCQPGFVGPNCESVCDKWNPCAEGAVCIPSAGSSAGYVCKCPAGRSGLYCERKQEEACPLSWWGHPICGPCNCATEKGFDPSCNKTTGECVCKEDHYRPADSDTCYPCECYTIGSFRRSCDPVTGQCPCRNGVIGRRCDTCASQFAEVTLRGCEVVYDSCPRSFQHGIWWDRTPFDQTAIQACPNGAEGSAIRQCYVDGWGEPDMFRCTSKQFSSLAAEIEKIEEEGLKVTTFVAKNMMAKLAEATNKTEKLYGIDVNITYRVIKHVLDHEVLQSGLNLTHTQDRNFIQNLVNSLSRALEPKYIGAWKRIQERHPGTIEIMYKMEQYASVLAHNMLQLFTQPFDSINENIVFGLDYVIKDNRTEVGIPKYNNKVQNTAMFDRDTQVYLPNTMLKEPSMKDMVVEMVEGKKPKAVVAYVMYKTIGNLLPTRYDHTISVPDYVLTSINSPTFSLAVVDGNKTVHGKIKSDVVLKFKQLEAHNHSSPQCVYYKFSLKSNNVTSGVWSSEGCELTERSTDPVTGHAYVKCQCDHLSSYAIIMDKSPIERTQGFIVSLPIITYILITIALICLLVALLVFCCVKGLHSNSNSIHINLVFVMFTTLIIFLFGIDKAEHELACKLVAIFLHYFFMCTFSWMFVETMHLYRMMTEIRNINQGSMKFYYVVGYVLPGIVVGLAVGLDTDSYGNDRFCWLETTNKLIWSFAGPIILCIALNIVLCIMALHVSCRAKAGDPDFSILRNGLKAAVVLLPLLAMAWVFGLLAVNDDVTAFHYIFAVSCLLQGLFVFLAHVLLNKRVRREIKYTWYNLSGRKDENESLHDNIRASTRSALAYHNESSLEGGLNRMNVGISTNSTTSRSTSKSSTGMYHPDGYLHSSTSTSGHAPSLHYHPPNVGIPPYGYDSSMFHEKPIDDPDTGERRRRKPRQTDSDSDSELSGMEGPHGDMDLASSHSSDDDEEEYHWSHAPKHKVLDRVKKQSIPDRHSHKTPIVLNSPSNAPPTYGQFTGSHWPGEGLSTTTAGSDTEVKGHSPLKVINNGDPPRSILYDRHSPRGSPKVPDLPPKPEVRFDLSHQNAQSGSGQGSPRSQQGSPSGSQQSSPDPVKPADVDLSTYDSLPHHSLLSGDKLKPPERIDSLPSRPDDRSRSPRDPRMTVQVLTHNGSMSETSESSSSCSDSESDLEEDWEKLAEEKARGIVDKQSSVAAKDKGGTSTLTTKNSPDLRLTGTDSKHTEKDSPKATQLTANSGFHDSSSKELSGKRDRYSIIEEDPQKEKEAEEDSEGENARETDPLNPS